MAPRIGASVRCMEIFHDADGHIQAHFQYDTTYDTARSKILFCEICGFVYLRRVVHYEGDTPDPKWRAVTSRCYTHGGAYWMLPNDRVEHLPIEVLKHDFLNFLETELDTWIRTTSRMDGRLIREYSSQAPT